jgi:hypothetical protein
MKRRYNMTFDVKTEGDNQSGSEERAVGDAPCFNLPHQRCIE